MPEQRDECHAARAGLVEVRGLGCTGVDGRDRRSLGDVTERMRVTDREIVEPALDARIATNREVGLIAVHVERAAMDASDAYSRVTGFAGREAPSLGRSPRPSTGTGSHRGLHRAQVQT